MIICCTFLWILFCSTLDQYNISSHHSIQYLNWGVICRSWSLRQNRIGLADSMNTNCIRVFRLQNIVPWLFYDNSVIIRCPVLFITRTVFSKHSNIGHPQTPYSIYNTILFVLQTCHIVRFKLSYINLIFSNKFVCRTHNFLEIKNN